MESAAVQTLADLVASRAAQDPSRPALTFVDIAPDGRYLTETRTFAQLHRNGLALAGWLATQGLRRGDAVALMMANHPEFVEAMIASAMLGVAFVPIDPRTVGEKLRFMLLHADCRGVICSADCAASIAAAELPRDHLSWAVVMTESGRELPPIAPACVSYGVALNAAGSPPRVQVSGTETMMMMFTSGTTGNPKAVAISHGAYMSRARGMHGIDIGAGDILYTGLSLTHINAQGTLRIGLTAGLPVVISRKFSKRHLWPICRAFGCTVFNILGGMIPEIYSIPERPDDADNPVRLIISAGMPADLWTAYERRYGVRICEIYGSTEGGGALTNPPDAGPIGSIGKPPPELEAAVFDDAGRRCGPMEPGELRFRRRDGEPTRISYFRDPDASDAKVRDGWFRTGDIVHADDNGWYFFHYRVGGGVRRDGDFINTALVESALIKSGLVADAFVYGVATPRNVAGEKTLVAAVVPSGTGVTEAALTDYCRKALQKRDVPEVFQMLAEIPKTISEKPIERACIDLLRADGRLDG